MVCRGAPVLSVRRRDLAALFLCGCAHLRHKETYVRPASDERVSFNVSAGVPEWDEGLECGYLLVAVTAKSRCFVSM